jgi:tRNA-Thr(GGU) m(6)t(6)A37 methyltransferase TsaA
MELRASVVGIVRKSNADSVYLEINSEYWDAVLNLDKFSHAIILWWIHKHDNPKARSNLRDFPPQEDAELSGVFASRSPARPTPIGLSIVAIISVDDKTRRIWIDQIDAIDGTPMIDIKPYMPSSDRVDEARVPKWFENNVPRYTT